MLQKMLLLYNPRCLRTNYWVKMGGNIDVGEVREELRKGGGGDS